MITEFKVDQSLVVIFLITAMISFLLGINGLGVLSLLAFLVVFKPTRYVLQFFGEVALGFVLIAFVIFVSMIALVYFFT